MFKNTEIAFRSKSDQELKNAKLLFYWMQFPIITSIGKTLIIIALKIKIPIKWLLKKTIFRQFVGGENIDECLLEVNQLFQNFRVGSILDYAVEGKSSEQSFEKAADHIIETITAAGKNEAIPFAVFKMSGIVSSEVLEELQENGHGNEASQFAFSSFQKRLDRIVKHALNLRKPLLIDAEESWIQEAINDIVNGLMQKHNQNSVQIFNTLQCYKKGAAQQLEKWHLTAKAQNYKVGVKLVRGAYMEKERERAIEKGYPSPICETKNETDLQFNSCVTYSLEHLNEINVFVASHNEFSFQLMTEKMKDLGLSSSDPRVFSAQLYGMSDHITFNLINEKFNVVKYMPYGPLKEVLPYLFRRANENKSVQGQSSRELRLIADEIKRRKL